MDKKVTVCGIECFLEEEKFPDGKKTTYRFTVPGWEECKVTGIKNAKRVISGRLDMAVRNTLGLKT